jgi:phenylalanyl-tRNA synthetase beta chain
MHYSYHWLRELSGTTQTPEDLAEFLTMRAFEVEAIEKVGFDAADVVIGEVTAVKKHPHADRLRVAAVCVGKETISIVCGAPNLAKGQKVPVALAGAKLPGNFVVQSSMIRDVASHGMICSQKELGLGEEHDGIMVLPESAAVGAELRTFLNDTDVLLEIKVLPDRAHDALGHVGMAREIAALERGVLDYDYDGLSVRATGSKAFDVTIEDEALSKRYSGALLHGVSVKSSPSWLRSRLRKLGVKSINNVVDVTNFVMLELGQPLHAFDWDAVSGCRQDGGKSIFIRRANAGESATLLDEKTYAFGEGDIVVADTNGILAAAGIMGGLASGITEKTRDVFLESAHFDAVSVRKTRARLGIRTDASDRFEKALDPNMVERAMARAIELLTHIAHSAKTEIVDIYPHPVERRAFSFSLVEAERLLGVAIAMSDMAERLPSMGFEVKAIGDDSLEVLAPTYRLDVMSIEDIIEDMGKLIGYDAIATKAPSVELAGVTIRDDRRLRRRFRESTCENGFSEAPCYAFYAKSDARAIGMEDTAHAELANPMNPDQALLRASLLPNLLKAVRENLKYGKSVRLFEVGNVFYASEFQAVHENEMFATILVLDGDEEPLSVLKGSIERILRGLNIEPVYDTAEHAGQFWHPTRTGDVFGILGQDAVHIGRIGEVHPFVLERYRIDKRAVYAEFDAAALLRSMRETNAFVPFRRFPEVLRDISLLVPKTVRVKDVTDIVVRKGGGFVLQTELFDRYFDETKDEKSLAFHVRFGASDRTLESVEVDALLADIVATLEKELKVERR